MKKLPVFIFLLCSVYSYGQLSELPALTTTSEQAFKDLANGVTNEGWFLFTSNKGVKGYTWVFRCTPTGISKAIDRFQDWTLRTSAREITDQSTIPSEVKKISGNWDLDKLAPFIERGKAEIKKIANANSKKVSNVSLMSGNKGPVPLVQLSILLRP